MFDKNYKHYTLGYNVYGVKYKQGDKFYNSKFEEVTEEGVPVIRTDKNIIVSKSSGNPFKTERAALSTLKKKKLDDQYQVIEYHGGYALESIL